MERVLAISYHSKCARLIRLFITLSTLSVLLAAMLIISIFLTALLHLHTALLIATLFIACMGSLIGSLLVFLYDINVPLKALELEIAVTTED